MSDGDAKRNIREHLWIAGMVFIMSLFWDHLINFLSAIGINILNQETFHPYRIGEFQIIILVLSLAHFVRKWNEWRYYKD